MKNDIENQTIERDRLAFSPIEFAKRIGRSTGFIRLEIARGRIKVVRHGRAILIPKESADAYLSVE